MLTPLVVIDWEWTRQANGKYELSYFKYIEDINGDVYTVKEWTKELVKTSVVDSIRRDYIGTVTVEENQLGTIPAVICYNKRSSVRGIGISDIRDIADQQRFIYNSKSEVDQSIRMNTHPSLVKTPNTQAGIGAGSIIHLDESMDPGLKPYLLEFNGASVESIYTAIEQCESMIDKIANTGAIRSTDAKRQSGVAQEQEFQLLNARLSDKANSIELAEEQMWKIWCQYQGLVWEGSIEYPDNFNIRDSINDLDFYLKASTASVNSETFRKELQKHIANLIIEDEIALEIAKAEIDESTMEIDLEMPAQNISVTVQEEDEEDTGSI
jgi:hypothetical protein